MEKINNVQCIEGFGSDSNCYLIDDIIVDTGTGMDKQHLRLKIEESGLNPDDISMIVNTHCHFDHAGGNYLFPEAEVAIHEKDAPYLENEDDPMTVAYLFGRSIERHDVDLKLKEGDKIANFEVLHTPGHSPGGISLWDGEVLISGDVVFANGGFGRLDIGGDLQEKTSTGNSGRHRG
jgi:glyoxylase-like metal-dependent hydrolase (beta-lactamase superfamily II)